MAVFEGCRNICREYLSTSAAEFSILKEELELSSSASGRSVSRMRITETEKLAMTASHSRDQRNLFSMMISKVDEMSNDSEIFDVLLDHLVEVERIWCLCEIFQFHQHGKLLSLDFARWLYETGRKDTETAMSIFESLDRPEYHSSGGRNVEGRPPPVEGYWETLYTFALQGSLSTVWDLMCLHSEFPRNDFASSGRSYVNSRGDGREFASELCAILDSHPYLSFVVRDDNAADTASVSEAPSSSLLSRDLTIWTERIQRLRQSGSTFLGRIPQIVKLLDILAGNDDSLKEASNNDWLLYTLGKLLYMYSPPLSRTNLEKILEQSIDSTASRSDSGSSSTAAGVQNAMFEGDTAAAKKKVQQNTVRSIVGGEVGVAIRHIFESRKAIDNHFMNQFQLVNILFLAPSILLCYFLIHGCKITDLNEPLNPEDPQSSGYFDRLVVLMVQELKQFKFPLPVLMNTINIPSVSLITELSLNVLPTLEMVSDEETLQLSDAIRTQAKNIINITNEVRDKLLVKASEVEIARGMYWFDRKELAKAVSFFEAADDMSRSTGVLDLMMQRLIQAVGKSSLFTGFPVKVSYFNVVDEVEDDVGVVLAQTRIVLNNISHTTYLSSLIKGLSTLYEVRKRRHENNNVLQESDAGDLQKTIQSLSSLVCEGHVPKRYIIFLLEAIVYTNDLFGQVHKDGTAIPKSMVYDLITKFELQMTSFNAERNLMNLDLTDLTTLRSKLLGMLSNSCLNENATFRHMRIARESTSDASISGGMPLVSSWSSSSTPDSAPVTSLDLLGGVALY